MSIANQNKINLKNSKHKKHKQGCLTSNWKEYNRQKQANYRAKKKTSKTKKLPSVFQQKKQNQLLKLLVNNRSFVPVPQKLKHPIIKNWNASDYWYPKQLDLNNLERGCVRILPDNWNNCAIIWLDIDQPKWTKLAKQLRCGYITSPKKHIRIPIPVKSLSGLKTGTLYYQNQKIGDAKLSGEVMLPGNAYYDKEGKFCGYYSYKAWGTFFPLNNKVWVNATEFFTYLNKVSGIEYKTISQHFIWQKILEKMLDYRPLFKETFFNPSREPPGRWKNLDLNNLSKAVNY